MLLKIHHKRSCRIYGASTIAVNIDAAKIDNKYEVIETGRERTGLELNYWIDKVQSFVLVR